MTRFVSEVRRSGAIPLLIAAPRRGLTADLIRRRFARSVPEAERLHDRYVDITREVARESGAELLDLAAILSGPECDPLFAPDGIHFDRYQDECLLGNTQPDPQVQRHIAAGVEQPGLRRIAAELDRKIREIVRGAAWATRAEGRATGSRGLP